jgi:hypothetical protein
LPASRHRGSPTTPAGPHTRDLDAGIGAGGPPAARRRVLAGRRAPRTGRRRSGPALPSGPRPGPKLRK